LSASLIRDRSSLNGLKLASSFMVGALMGCPDLHHLGGADEWRLPRRPET